MSANIIISYDGTNNEDDAVALGRLFAATGADVSLAYVRHAPEEETSREILAQHEAETLLERGTELLGDREAPRHVITDRSTPEGLASSPRRTKLDVIVFCSDSHTARGHIGVGNSAQRLLDGWHHRGRDRPGRVRQGRSAARHVASASPATAAHRRPPRRLPRALGAELGAAGEQRRQPARRRLTSRG